MNIKNDVHFLNVRPSTDETQRVGALAQALKDNRLILQHRENHVYILDRETGKAIAQFHQL